MVFVAHVNIARHEENYILRLATGVNIFLQCLKVVKTVYAVAASFDAVCTRGEKLADG